MDCWKLRIDVCNMEQKKDCRKQKREREVEKKRRSKSQQRGENREISGENITIVNMIEGVIADNIRKLFIG